MIYACYFNNLIILPCIKCNISLVLFSPYNRPTGKVGPSSIEIYRSTRDEVTNFSANFITAMNERNNYGEFCRGGVDSDSKHTFNKDKRKERKIHIKLLF